MAKGMIVKLAVAMALSRYWPVTDAFAFTVTELVEGERRNVGRRTGCRCASIRCVVNNRARCRARQRYFYRAAERPTSGRNGWRRHCYYRCNRKAGRGNGTVIVTRGGCFCVHRGRTGQGERRNVGRRTGRRRASVRRVVDGRARCRARQRYLHRTAECPARRRNGWRRHCYYRCNRKAGRGNGTVSVARGGCFCVRRWPNWSR